MGGKKPQTNHNALDEMRQKLAYGLRLELKTGIRPTESGNPSQKSERTVNRNSTVTRIP